ncbi:MAG: LarC family nickel insertion protein [Synechococcaceae cyanobacterium]|nr:LarC family nickel insertion protein [Synechococcaceae cyanobacterium]
MNLALVDCPTGLAGNMLLAALFDLGVPTAVVEEPLAALGLAGAYRLELEERRSEGLRGLHLAVQSLEPEPAHRPWGPLRRRLEEAPLPAALQGRVLEVFGLLAEAEARVHGIAAERVHFHEIGAIDALVDIVGVCAGLLHLQPQRLLCSPPPAGHGTVTTAHGPLPLPAPAVLEIARLRQLPLAGSGGFPAGELTTPTGLALMACWADRFGPAPSVVPLQSGVGLGSRRLDRPNLLRLTLARSLDSSAVAPGEADPSGESGAEDPAAAGSPTEERQEALLQQQAQIDDATAEDLAHLAEALRQAGAVEVFSQAITMKKGRQGALITALLPPALAPALRRVWWQHSTTIGLREQLQQRWLLPRRLVTLETALGPLRCKITRLPGGGERLKPEHDDLLALARRHNLSLEQLRSRLGHQLGQA